MDSHSYTASACADNRILSPPRGEVTSVLLTSVSRPGAGLTRGRGQRHGRAGFVDRPDAWTQRHKDTFTWWTETDGSFFTDGAISLSAAKGRQVANNPQNVNTRRRRRKPNGRRSIRRLAQRARCAPRTPDRAPSRAQRPAHPAVHIAHASDARRPALRHRHGRARVSASPRTCGFPCPSPAARPRRMSPTGGAAPRTPPRLRHAQHGPVGAPGRVS